MTHTADRTGPDRTEQPSAATAEEAIRIAQELLNETLKLLRSVNRSARCLISLHVLSCDAGSLIS